MTSARGISTRKPSQVFAARLLPGLSIALARSADTLVTHAQPLLRFNQAVLLSATVSTRVEPAALLTNAWNAVCSPVPLLPMVLGDANSQQFTEFEKAARALLDDLIRRWPANARPPAVGIFTDGSGVAFSSDHPSPLSSDWLAQHQAGRCPTTTLLPFCPDGGWARIISPAASAFLH